MKIPFRKITDRITGFDLPFVGGGLSWNPPVSEIELAKRLITFLEDRRVLYYPYDAETPNYVVMSVLDIRKRLTSDLEQLDRTSSLAQSLLAMRAACRKFLDTVEGKSANMGFGHRHRIWDREEADFFIALGELRATVGSHAAQIAVRYEIDVEDTLFSIFPEAPEEGAG